MTKDEIFNKIAKIIEERFEIEPSKITRDLRFKEDLNADSIDIVEFILELEDTFDAQIGDDDAEKLETVGAAVDYISEQLAK